MKGLKNFLSIGFIIFAVSWIIMLAAAVAYSKVNFYRGIVLALLIIGLTLGAGLFVLQFLKMLGEWKNLVLLAIAVLFSAATILSVYNQLDALGYFMAGLTPFSVVKNYIISVTLLATASALTIVSSLFGIKENVKDN